MLKELNESLEIKINRKCRRFERVKKVIGKLLKNRKNCKNE